MSTPQPAAPPEHPARIVLLVDTNIWLAAGDRRSRHHDACTTVLADHADELAATTLVIAETAWLLLDRAGPAAQAAFTAMITTGRLEPVELTTSDWARVHQLVTTYTDLTLDIIDASTIAVAEPHGHTTIATLDHVRQPSYVNRAAVTKDGSSLYSGTTVEVRDVDSTPSKIDPGLPLPEIDTASFVALPVRQVQADNNTLPSTGSDTGSTLSAAVAGIATGVMLLLIGRRRRTQS